MGMTIEEAMEFLENSKHLIAPSKEPNLGNACDVAIDTMRKYQLMQADYNARLKADMVAMLEDLDLLIDEFDSGCGWYGLIKKVEVHKLIQQKINVLQNHEINQLFNAKNMRRTNADNNDN